MQFKLEGIRDILEVKGLDALLITNGRNRQYVSGFVGSTGTLLITQTEALLITDFRYVEQASKQTSGFEIIKSNGWTWLSQTITKLGLKTIGFESTDLSVHSFEKLKEAVVQIKLNPNPILVPTVDIVETLRTVKATEEISEMQHSIDISDRAMDSVCPTIHAGLTEREVAWRMEKAMRDYGADSTSFDTIVARGPNSAMPHHRASDDVIHLGDPLVIDMGALRNGYCSDITRTIFIGDPDPEFKQIYDIVLAAQLTAIETIQPGMTGETGDNLARTVLNEAGYGDNFGHSLGHGIGLDVHELPRLGPNSQDILSENMIFSVEPGIYISGLGGVRIEDLVVLTKDGAKQLSKARK
jgi:Xaa-Pro aminopeptidase